jgi:peptidoglycan/LPS O-acetylase OafA/YrhL
LEVSRGLAALWVFMFHVKYLFEQTPLLHRFCELGSFGVPMFFVISGYVITYSAESSLANGRPATTFLVKRFMRIYPTFWVSVMVVLAIPFLIELISSLKTGEYVYPESVIDHYSFVEWFHIVALTKVFFSVDGDLQAQFNLVNAVYWTLAIEFQFYLVVFLSLLCRSKYKWVIAMVSLFSFMALFYDFNFNPGLFIYYWPMFFVGGLLAYVHRYKFYLERFVRHKNLSIYLFIVLLWLVVCGGISQLLEVSGFVFSVMFALSLWLCSPFEKILMKIKNTGSSISYWILESFLILGAMSYSVYLLHSKLSEIPRMFVRQLIDSSSLAHGLLTVLLTLLICFPFYFYIERRFMSSSHSNLHRNLLSKSTKEHPAVA